MAAELGHQDLGIGEDMTVGRRSGSECGRLDGGGTAHTRSSYSLMDAHPKLRDDISLPVKPQDRSSLPEKLQNGSSLPGLMGTLGECGETFEVY